MTASTQRTYDPQRAILWVHWPDLTGQTLIGRPDLQPFIDILLGHASADGPVKAIRFVLYDQVTADYNHDSLKFVRIETWLDHDGTPRALRKKDAPSFDVRQDFGIA